MIGYSPVARRQVRDLLHYYREKQRPEAIRSLGEVLRTAEQRILSGKLRPRRYPATYQDLASPGRHWLREGGYWIAYRDKPRAIIVGVFWETADIGSRFKR